MSEQNIKKMIGKAFLDIAEGIKSKDFGKKVCNRDSCRRKRAR